MLFTFFIAHHILVCPSLELFKSCICCLGILILRYALRPCSSYVCIASSPAFATLLFPFFALRCKANICVASDRRLLLSTRHCKVFIMSVLVQNKALLRHCIIQHALIRGKLFIVPFFPVYLCDTYTFLLFTLLRVFWWWTELFSVGVLLQRTELFGVQLLCVCVCVIDRTCSFLLLWGSTECRLCNNTTHTHVHTSYHSPVCVPRQAHKHAHKVAFSPGVSRRASADKTALPTQPGVSAHTHTHTRPPSTALSLASGLHAAPKWRTLSLLHTLVHSNLSCRSKQRKNWQ